MIDTTQMRTNAELIVDELRADSAFRAEWHRTATARASAIALVRYRADHDVSQRGLADRLEMTLSQVAELELGSVNPSRYTLTRDLGTRDRAACRRRAVSLSGGETRWDSSHARWAGESRRR
jgi:DNA-binding transcriptional regulator YiaG